MTERTRREWFVTLVHGRLLAKAADANLLVESESTLRIATQIPVAVELRVPVLDLPDTDQALQAMAEDVAEEFARRRRAAMDKRAPPENA